MRVLYDCLVGRNLLQVAVPPQEDQRSKGLIGLDLDHLSALTRKKNTFALLRLCGMTGRSAMRWALQQHLSTAAINSDEVMRDRVRLLLLDSLFHCRSQVRFSRLGVQDCMRRLSRPYPRVAGQPLCLGESALHHGPWPDPVYTVMVTAL